MIMTQDKTKLAMAAMAIDCEGCISISRVSAATKIGTPYYNYNLKVSVVNTSLRLMRWLVRYFGGDFYEMSPGKLGKRQCFKWSCLGGHKKVEAFLLGILPYLLIKREQALTALEYVRMTGVENPERRYQLWEKMKNLHQCDEDVESPTTNMSDASEDAKIESELHGDMQSDPVVIQVS
jgi:hypothetical protein